MNKRISTLLTAGLLMVSALFGSANAALTPVSADGDLQNGAKFYLGRTDNGYVSVNTSYKVNGTAVATFSSSAVSTVEQTTVFEVADYVYNAVGNFSTFTLNNFSTAFAISGLVAFLATLCKQSRRCFFNCRCY